MKRMSILGLMVVVLLVGVCFVSLRHSSEAWAGILSVAILVTLCLSILGVVYRRKGKQAFWVGFMLLGWIYLGLNSMPDFRLLSASKKSHSLAEDTKQHWITGLVLVELYPYVRQKEVNLRETSMIASLLGRLDPKTQAILNKLDLPIPMPFVTETPLEDVIKYIKTATTDPSMPQGIPVYIDPVGLQESEKTMQSPIVMNLESIPLKISLEKLLNQIDETYEVRDGLVIITSRASSLDALAGLQNFLRIGHCWWTLLAACLGGFAGRWFYSTRNAGLETLA